MKKTKEDLVMEIAQLEEKIQTYQKSEKRVSQDFAKVFGWYETRDTMTARFDRKDLILKVPTWSEVFAEVGKLIELKKQHEISNYGPSVSIGGRNLDQLIEGFLRLKSIEEND